MVCRKKDFPFSFFLNLKTESMFVEEGKETLERGILKIEMMRVSC